MYGTTGIFGSSKFLRKAIPWPVTLYSLAQSRHHQQHGWFIGWKNWTLSSVLIKISLRTLGPKSWRKQHGHHRKEEFPQHRSKQGWIEFGNPHSISASLALVLRVSQSTLADKADSGPNFPVQKTRLLGNPLDDSVLSLILPPVTSKSVYSCFSPNFKNHPY